MVQRQWDSHYKEKLKTAKTVPGQNGAKRNPRKSLEMNVKENGVRNRAGSGSGLETLIGISAGDRSQLSARCQ